MNKIVHITKSEELKVGQFYSRIDEDGQKETYIVAKTSGKYILICLDDGHFWSFASEEIANIFGTPAQREQFNLVTNPFTIYPH